MRKSRRLSSHRGQVDFQEWVSTHMSVDSQQGAEWICDCPVCGRPKLAVNVTKAAFQCWTCGFAGWQPARLAAAVLGIGLREAEDQLSTGVLSLSATIQPLDVQADRRGALPEAPLPPGTIQGLQGEALTYAHQRGIPSTHSELFGLSSILGDASDSLATTLLSRRLLIPAKDLRGRTVYWVARATDDNKIKTLNTPRPERHEAWGLKHVVDAAVKNEVLVGLHLLTPGCRVIIVEGPMDAVVCGPGFVATMGASISIQQAALLAAAGVAEAVILYDPDNAGRKGAKQAYERLSPAMRVLIAECPSGRDPADLGRAGALEAAAQAVESVPIDPLPDLAIPVDRGELRSATGWISPLK